MGWLFNNSSRKSSLTSASSFTRREWSALLVIAPAAAQVSSTGPPAGSPAPSKSPATPQERAQKALSDIREGSGRLSKLEVPMDIEPAFSFRA
jgi:hypothetical protein